MRIAIPSKKRASLITTDKFFSKNIDLFVEPQDLESYQKYYTNSKYKVIDIGSNDKGISFVRKFIANGELKHYRIGKFIKISEDDLNQFVESKKEVSRGTKDNKNKM